MVDSPRQARVFVAGRLEDWGCLALTEVAEVLVSELVTNAVVHAATDLTLRVALEGGRLRVEVTDSSEISVQVQDKEPGAPDGRGLLIVDAMADRWGEKARPGGKTVWFELLAAGSDRPPGG